MKDFVRHYKRFSIMRKRNPVSKDAFALYHLLMEYDNELGWMDNFTAPNGMLTGSLRGFSQDSLERARNELISKGYIRYSRGSGNQAGKYLIIDLAEQNTVQPAEQNTVQPAEQNTVQPRNKSRTLTKPNENQNQTKNTTPPPPDAQADAFEQFWSAYPKKKSKADAQKAWKQAKVTSALQEQIMKAVEAAKKSADWLKEDGRYIPYPATWLRAGGWDDEISPSSSVSPSYDPTQDFFYGMGDENEL